MSLPELSIRRPVLATVMSLMLILLGIISFTRLTLREYPDIESPVVSVRVVYPGASADVIESQITEPLEDALAGVEGLETLASVSREQVSQITLTFSTQRDVEDAASDVRDRVARSRGKLPEAAEDPIIAKTEADAQAIMWLGLTSDRMNALDLTDYAERQILDTLRTLPGVSSVTLGGMRRYAMRIWLDRARMAARGVTVQDVEAALRRQNVELPAGRIESVDREFTVRSDTGLSTVSQFNDLILRQERGYSIRLSDIGQAAIGAEDERNVIRVNGRPAIGLGIVKQSKANTLDVARAVKAVLPQIQARLPSGTHLAIGYDSSLFIERSIQAVYKTLGEAVLLVTGVIFLFLRNLRATLIPLVTIPVSLIGAFFCLYLLGFSINTLTLLGLVLAVGLVVDDAIVVLENIHRHIEQGSAPRDAAKQGSREIAFAVIAMTITLAAVFTPLAFLEGKTGRLFIEFAMTVSAAVLVSGFVALSLSPMMCAKLLRRDVKDNPGNRAESLFHAIIHHYRRLLGEVLQHRWIAAVILSLAALLIWLMLPHLKSELAPQEDRSSFLVSATAPDGASLAYTDRYARRLQDLILTIPEVRTAFIVTAPGLERPNDVTRAFAFVQLHPWENRERRQQDITEALKPILGKSLYGVRAVPINQAPLGQGRTLPVQFVIQAETYEILQKAVALVMQQARENPGLENVDTDLKMDTPQVRLTINRDLAADQAVPVETIGQTLETLLAGRQVTRFTQGGKQYDVIVQLQPGDRDSPGDIGQIQVRNKDDQLIRLDSLVSLHEAVTAKNLNHFNRKRAAIISANLAPGYTLGEALAYFDQAAAQIDVPIRTDVEGQSREFRKTGGELWMALALALAFIYLVLSAQFESFIHPFTILLTVPLAAAGAIAALLWQGGTLNVYSQIGLVMLVGLITKHGILIVEFANQHQGQGMTPRQAVLEAATLRLRPILMTSAAMILGALPLALASGAGAESRHPIGWVIVGGLTFGTLFTLFVVPAAYTLLTPKRLSPE